MSLDAAALDALFHVARTQNKWTDQPVTDDELKAIFDLAKMAPTSVNSSPARFVFVRTPEAKEKLKEALSPGNVEKTMTAPVTVIVAYDPKFYDQLPKLFPHVDARAWFAGNEAFAEETAFRNSTLQGAYIIMAARALGVDSGAMSGFNKDKVNELFFAESGFKANFLINLGHGDETGLFARSPRFEFDEACTIV